MIPPQHLHIPLCSYFLTCKSFQKHMRPMLERSGAILSTLPSVAFTFELKLQQQEQRTKKTKNVRSSLTGYAPPDQIRLGPLCATSGNTGPSARQTPGAGPSTRRSTDYAPPLWCGHPKSHLYLSGIRHSQWSCPSPA